MHKELSVKELRQIADAALRGTSSSGPQRVAICQLLEYIEVITDRKIHTSTGEKPKPKKIISQQMVDRLTEELAIATKQVDVLLAMLAPSNDSIDEHY
jgi:hypothetical protein